MRKYLLPESGNFYKANLHCHSTVSDGDFTPEFLKKIYKEKGYSIIAYTDHDVLIPHADLTDDEFLPLNGYEVEVFSGKEKTCHICLIALEPDNLTQVCYHRTQYIFGNAVNYRDKIKFREDLPDYERVYTPECINDIMKTGRDNGFFVTYNHPMWSMETFEEYSRYHNMHAMEICNFGCCVLGYRDDNDRVYDDMLMGGERIFCIATDDNHNRYPMDSDHFDSFGGYTVIKAEKLDYRTITKALEAGNFYASKGPEIYDLYFEDGKINIECSPANRIILNVGRRRAECVYGKESSGVTKASFNVVPEDVFVRLTVVDNTGEYASTNAYFTDELFS